MTTQERTYQESADTLLSIINDMAELQKAEITLSDSAHGRIGYSTELYGTAYTFLFEVSQLPKGCRIRIQSEQEQGDTALRLRQMFILLESMLYA